MTSLVNVLRKLRPSKTKPEDRNRRPTRKKRKKKMQICDFPCLVNVPTPSCLPLYKRCAAGTAAWFSDFYKREQASGILLTMLFRLLIFIFLCLGFRYISYTQMIAEIDGINFVFLFSTFCQLSRQAFISNRVNERVSGKPTNLN